MNTNDFLKFTYQNNLNNTYEIGRYFLKKYSLPETISLLSEKTDAIYNVYDLLRQNDKLKKITINCNQTNNVNFKEFSYTIPQGKMLYDGRGQLYNFDEGEIEFMGKNDEYILLRFNTRTINPISSVCKVFFNLSYGRTDLPGGAVLTTTSLPIPISTTYVENIYFCNKYFVNNQGNTYKLGIDSFLLNYNKVNTYSMKTESLLDNIITDFENTDFLLYINIKKNIGEMAAYNTLTDTLTKGKPFFIYAAGILKPVYFFLNIGWKANQIQYTTTQEIKFYTRFINDFHEEKIIKWLKSLSLYKMKY